MGKILNTGMVAVIWPYAIFISASQHFFFQLLQKLN
jgi:hypothetical protein